MQSLPVQAKLSIGKSDDEFEKEADQVADTVMRLPDSSAPGHGEMSSPALKKASPVTPLYLQRLCADCEQQQQGISDTHVQASVGQGSSSHPDHGVEHQLKTPSGGSHVPHQVRHRSESVLGADLSHVRVHDDVHANSLARRINARAFTHGNNIWLGSGESDGDMGLMAHELTHTVQQGATQRSPQIQKLDDDFRITGLSREGDSSKIYFAAGGASIPGSEYSKLSALATPASQNLTLFGYSSEEGSDAGNSALIDRRIAGVSQALFRRGHRATRTPRARLTDSTGQMDYRSMRAVEVLPTPAPVSGVPVDPVPSIDNCAGPAPLPDDSCGTTLRPCSNSPADATACGSSFTTAFSLASNWIVTAVSNLASTDAAMVTRTDALLAQLFPGVARSTVLTNLISIMVQVLNSPMQHRCHNDCDSGCDRPAYNSGVGVGAGGAVTTLCPGFINGTDTTFNAEVLVHESTHGTSGVNTEDLGYGSSRLVANMTGPDALRNTDSYVLLIRLLHSPGSVTIGPDPSIRDDVVGMNAVEESQARSAVAYMESWLNYGSFDSALMYAALNRSVPPATQWSHEGSDQTHEIPLLHQLSSLFGLTDPGAAAPFDNTSLPGEEDKNRIAAIHDRYSRMYSSVDREKLTVTKGSTASWSADSDGFILQNSLTVAAPFFALNLENQVLHLIRMMAQGLPDISAPYVDAYASAANHIRRKRTLGP
jgi:hypothetical protein